MIRSITVEAGPPESGEIAEGGWVLAPRPFPNWGERFLSFAAEGVSEVREVCAKNSGCRGYLMRAANPAAGLTLRYDFLLCDDTPDDWFWTVQDNRFTAPSDGLSDLARDIVGDAPTQRDALGRLIAYAGEVFSYGHVDQQFNQGHDSVPAVSGGATGSCVDINTFLLAAARAIGVRGQYVAGYWFHPERTYTRDMHCWLAFEPDGELVFWDVAHGLKWADGLGARVQEGLNPAGGRRVGMSCGRGLEFDTPHGEVCISHFSEPVWLASDGAAARYLRPQLMIEARDPGGIRTQTPGAAREADVQLKETAA